MTRAIRIAIAATLALASLAPAAMAQDDELEIPQPNDLKIPLPNDDDLKVPMPPKGGVFEVTLKGTQVSTWTQKHDPQFACDSTVRGDGSQTVRYDHKKPIRVHLVDPKRGRPVLTTPSDTLAENGVPGMFVVLAVNANREGSQQTIAAPGGACNGTGGWDGVTPKQDCDEDRWGRMDASIGYAAHGVNKPPRPGHVQVAGRYSAFSDAPMPGPTSKDFGEPLANTFDNCPYWAQGAADPATDELVLATDKLPVGKLKKLKKGKTLKASGAKRATYAEGDYKGDTLNTWNLKIKRVL